MAAFLKVEVALNKQSIVVGAPSPQTVNVVVPNRGPKGDTGETGPTGPANSLSIGTVTTGAAGSSASATITGTAPDQTLDLAIPRGDKGEKGDTGDTGATGATGPANTLSIGTVTTGAEGAPAAATITGDAPNQTLSLTLPVGATGATGPQGPAGEQTTDASLLTSGTLADARLSSNVALKDAANTFTANQTFSGTNSVAPNQTAASGSSLMTRDLGDARHVRQLVGTTLPTPSYTSSANHNAWIVERWTTNTGMGGLAGNTSLRGIFVRGLYCIDDSVFDATKRKSLQIAPFTGYTASNQCLVHGFCNGGSFYGTFAAKSNFVDLLANRISSRLLMWSSGVASQGYRYRFSANFSASAGDTIVMSPSGHTFVVDRTITDATVFTNETTGGVFVRSMSAGSPTTSDTSLTVNGGPSISTTFQINSATNSGTNPSALLFPSTVGWNLWSNSFGDSGFYQIFFLE